VSWFVSSRRPRSFDCPLIVAGRRGPLRVPLCILTIRHSASGGCESGFHAHFAGVHHGVVKTLFLLKVVQIGDCRAEAIKEAQRLKVFAFIIPTTDHSVNFGHWRSLAVDLFILQDGRGPLRVPLCQFRD
jgi:hypothetical protein